MPSPQAEQINAAMKAVTEGFDSVPTLEQQRAGGEQFGALTAPATDVHVEVVDAGGVEAMWETSPGASDRHVLLYLHGGGYVACSMYSHQHLVAHFAKAAGVRALNLNYRLAPEHPFPAAVEDAVAAYRWLLVQGYEPGNIAMTGDSAGGGLALAALLTLRDAGDPMPGAVVTFSAYADATCTGDTYRTMPGEDYLVSIESAEVSWAYYLTGGGDPRNPLVSPVFAEFHGFPPMLLQVGGSECLLDDSRRVAERAQAVGVDATLDVWPEMQHVFQVAAGNMPEADEALAQAGAFLRQRLGVPTPQSSTTA